MSELIKIKAEDYGLEESKAKEVSVMFTPMLDQMEALEEEYNEVVKEEDLGSRSRMAKQLRLKYVKVRTGTAAIHKDLKQFYLQGGRFVDGWKNAQLMASQGKENNLMEMEKHFENLEKERKEKLQSDRENELTKEGIEEIPMHLGEMSDEVWDNYKFGAIAGRKAQLEREAKEEAERIAKEKAEKEEQERIRNENEKLKKEAEEKEKQDKIEAEKRAKEEKSRLAKEAKEKDEREKKERDAKEKHEAELKVERQKQAQIELEERQKREKLEAELKAKKEAEEQAESKRLAGIEAELKKGDIDKVKDLVGGLEDLKTKYEFKAKKNKDTYKNVNGLIDKVISYIMER